MWPHLTTREFLIVVVLIAAWRLPDWLRKFVRLADELHSFRTRWPQLPAGRRWWRWWS